MLQLWTISNLQRLDYSIRRKIVFYAPLTEHLDFYGVDPLTYTWSGSTSAGYRGGTRTITGPAPVFNFTGETPNGLFVDTANGVNLYVNPANGLDNSNTLIWFESRVPKSTPTQTNPMAANGYWTGAAVYISHLCKANAVLANLEITAIQAALLDTVQTIPAPPTPPTNPLGSPITETPAGSTPGTVFTLSQDPDLASLALFWGGLYIKRVVAAPAEMEFVSSGAGGRTLTLGSTVQTGQTLVAQYVSS